MFSVKLCGHHEEEALRPPKLSNLNEFLQVYDRKKNNVFKNMSKLEKPSGEEEGRTESGGSQETTGLVWSPQLGWSLHRPEPSRETSTSTFPALFQATFNWDPSTTTPPTDNGLFKPTQIDVCHVGESYDAESCREHFKILIQFNYFCKVQKCIHPNPSQPQQIRLQLLLKHTTLNVKVQFFRRIDKLKASFCYLYDVDLIVGYLYDNSDMATAPNAPRPKLILCWIIKLFFMES